MFIGCIGTLECIFVPFSEAVKRRRLTRKLVTLLFLSIAGASILELPSGAQATSGIAAAARDPQGTEPPKPNASDQNQQMTSSTKNDASAQPASDKDPVKPTPQAPSTQGKVQGTSNDRLLFALPNFLTLQGTDRLPPMPVKDKFKVVALSTFDPVNFAWWGLLSGISQGENSEPAYGQGWVAYAKRYGTTAGDSTVENFMVGAVFPSVLHQDPRFYESSDGGFWRRSWYAGTRIVVTRGDSGHKQFNFSEIFGSAFAAAISTYSYHPKSTYLSVPTNPHMFVPSDRTLLNTTNVWGTQVGLDTITFEIKEFWPDIHRMLKHQPKIAMTEPVATH